jgi:hypothetical protein
VRWCIDSVNPDDVLDSDEVINQSGATIIRMDDDAKHIWRMPGTDDDAPAFSYEVPNNVQVHWLGTSHRQTLCCTSGNEVMQKLDADASLEAQYMAVSGKLSAKTALSSRYKSDTMYAFVLDNYERYVAKLDVRMSLTKLLDTKFLDDVGALPSSFDAKDKTVRGKFFDFFDRWGTHLVTGVTYGQRLVVEIEEKAFDEESQRDFEVNVRASYDGLVAKVEGEANVKGSDEYNRFQKTKKERCTIQGGDPNTHSALKVNPNDQQAYIAWGANKENVGTGNAIRINLETFSEVLLPLTAGDSEFRKILNAMDAALSFRTSYRWLLSNGSNFGPQELEIVVQGPCTVTLEFSGDPLVRVRLEAPMLLDSPSGTFTVSDDQKAIRYSGSATMVSRASCHFSIYCGPLTDFKLRREGSKGWTAFINGPTSFINESAHYHHWHLKDGEEEASASDVNLHEGVRRERED